MSDLEKAARDAVEAAANTRQVEQIAAFLAAQQLLNAQQQAPAAAPAPRQEFDAKKWLVIGGVTVSVGLVGAVFALAIAIAACATTGCFLILRSVWRESQKGR
ncbi:hypothetical protein [Streptomyces flaveolus]|uniref:hypothetical protein n=1 Tax=Streptomyces flaveolus TaxID=67297 RepID=UPI0036F6CEE0